MKAELQTQRSKFDHLDKNKQENNNKETSKPTASKHWRRIPPKNGEPKVKSIDGVEWKYCHFYRRWNTGNKAHTTDKHVVGYRRDDSNKENKDKNS